MHTPLETGSDETDVFETETCSLPENLPIADWLGREISKSAAEDAKKRDQVEGQRLTAEFATKSPQRLDAGKLPIEYSPLFGGHRQKELSLE